jgi:dihydrofolate reductase
MRKIISGFASSLDGYIEGPNGEIDWILIDPEIDFVEEMKRFDTFLYGRRSYEAIIKMGYGKPSPGKHYVFSTTLEKVAPGYELISSDIDDHINRIRSAPGKDIALYGGASLLASLLNKKMVDEISVAVIPVLIGKGKPMVEALDKNVSLRLLSTKRYGNGTIQLSYEVKYPS